MKNIFTSLVLILTFFSFCLTAQVRIYTPEMESPADSAIGLPPDAILSWYAVTGGGTGIIEYDIQLDTDPGFPSPVIFHTELVSGVQMSELTFGETYFWRVKAKDGDEISDWSETWSFTVLVRPVITKPKDASKQTPEPLLEWEEVTGIDYYDYQFDTVYFWSDVSGFTDEDLFDAAALSADQAWMVGAKGLILFWDGLEWSEVESNTSDDLLTIFILDASNAWIGGEGGTLLFSDGGAWTEVESNTSENINDLFFLDTSNGWAVADGGEICYYDGNVWAMQSSGTTKDLYAVDFIDANNGWTCGKSGTMLYYNGTEWVEQESNITRDLYSLAVNSEGLSFAGAKSGKIVQFDGETWSEYPDSPVSKDINSMIFTNPNSGWAVCKSGGLIQYDGNTWFKPTSGTQNDLFGIFIGNGAGLIAGEEGTQIVLGPDGFNSAMAVVKSVEGTETELQMEDMCFGATFYWRMRVRHPKDTSEWSTPLSFYTAASPDLLDPKNGSSGKDLNITLKWRRVSTNVSYEVEIDDDPNFNTPIIIPTTEIQIEAELLKYGVEYSWRTRALHSKDVSDWSETWTFSTTNTVALSSPSNNAENITTVPVLEWKDIGGTLSYLVQLDESSDFDDPIINEEVEHPETKFIVPIILDQDKEYYWRVKAQISNDSTNWSTTWKFRTVESIGIDEGNDLDLISLYPNPARDQLFITPSAGMAALHLSISDLLGKEHIKNQIDIITGETAVLDISTLPGGIYLVRLTDGENISIKKLIVE